MQWVLSNHWSDSSVGCASGSNGSGKNFYQSLGIQKKWNSMHCFIEYFKNRNEFHSNNSKKYKTDAMLPTFLNKSLIKGLGDDGTKILYVSVAKSSLN